MTIVRNGPKFFEDMERYITQWRNVAMGGPQADAFITLRKNNQKRVVKNTRIYSFQLIRTFGHDIRWRGRYNDDTILALDLLRNRWATILCYHFIMKKMQTMTVRGGNTDHLYAAGTGPKSRMLARVYPKYVKITYRFGRIHHHIDYKKHFGDIPLILDKAAS